MQHANLRLQALVDQLDQLGPDTTLASVAAALTAAALTPNDVAAFVRPNPANYHRARVVKRDRYELLVMTWLPGQASEPHDHSGSICAMHVVRGEAAEGEFAVAADGFADLEFEATIPTGKVSGGQDAGVHAVRNPSATAPLITVHVYAPPLTDVRRYTPRPAPIPRPPRSGPPTVFVVGGGFCGTMTAAHLLASGPDFRVVLAERRGTVGEGIAYGTRDGSHLLNVPAARMSAWPDRPEDFLEWARNRDATVRPGDFLSRKLYGEYLRESLHHAAGRAAGRLDIRLGEVRRVARHPAGGWMVHLDRGPPERADAVVLAIGHRPPSDPLRGVWNGPRDRFLADPWQPFALTAVPPDEPVAVLGSGLTALDTVLSLTELPRTAPITLVSRGGLLPHPHAVTPEPPADLRAFADAVVAASPTAAGLARAVRRLVRDRAAVGGDWRPVVDGLRPHTARLWQALSATERRRFIARLRPFWEVHRHRMPPTVAAKLRDLRERGLVRTQAGQIAAAEATPGGVRLTIRSRGGDTTTQQTGWVLNCTGPAPSNRPEANPVIGSLLVGGWVRRDELALGLDVAADGRAVAADGTTVSDLFVVGTLRKPQTWESTAVPELRQQAAQVASELLRTAPPDGCI